MQWNKIVLSVVLAFFAIAIMATFMWPAASALAVSPMTGAPKQTLRLATTTSMQDTGLLDSLLPAFEKANSVDVKVTAVGSGAAIQMGREGDADVLIAHSPVAEEAFMKEGYGSDRTQFAHNYFVIVGPKGDPAGIRGMDNAVQAFRQISDSKSTFVGRGDNSGTAIKEASLWKSAGLPMPGRQTAWYKSTGMGMAETLRMADEMNGYALSDRSTFLNDRKDLSALEILVDATPDMLNTYNIIAVSKEKHPGVNSAMAQKFLEYMTSPEAQAKISQYGQQTVGQPLFMTGPPAAAGQPATARQPAAVSA
ncbi:MAG: PBP superfamily domain protein [Methanocella sp. PtaU1.Bin125]|nr:MAG: PBP superfamily domain protein [Methanocella sp. PtaU1.Bin125]